MKELSGDTIESPYQPCAPALFTFMYMYMSWKPMPLE